MTATEAARVARRTGRWLWQGTPGSLAEVSARQRRAHARAVTVVRAFYGLFLVWLLQEMGSWMRLRASTSLHAPWPAAWIPRDDPTVGITIVLVALAVAIVWAAVMPQVRLARIAVAVTLLEYIAVVNGFGKIVHNLHALLYLAFALVLLPSGPWERATTVARRQLFLTVVWVAQALMLFAYGMTGVWKVVWAVNDLFDPNREPMLVLDGFSVLLARRVIDTGSTPMLADAIIDRPWLGWLLYVGTIYIEAGSLLVITRPRLHRLWGFGLIGFHVGTQLAMGFAFTYNVALLVLFLVLSPQTVDPAPWRTVLGDLPGVLEARWVLRRLRRRSRAPAAGVAPAP